MSSGTAASGSQAVKKCAICDSTGKLQRCGGCRIVWYCGRAHQKQDWNSHKDKCTPPPSANGSSNGSNRPRPAPTLREYDHRYDHALGRRFFPGVGLFYPDPHNTGMRPTMLYENQVQKEWMQDTTLSEGYEFLIDAYRLRIDDDYNIGGNAKHGLYEAKDPTVILKHFLLFSKLAQREGYVISSWNWADYLKKGKTLLPQTFGKSDCIAKYNKPMPHMKARGLAERVLGYGLGPNPMGHRALAHDNLKMEIDRKNADKGLWDEESRCLFTEVGGWQIWKRLHEQLSRMESLNGTSGATGGGVPSLDIWPHVTGQSQ